ncbi:MAG TPA: helix-turn-helix transcriptional regulator, partial [Sandaracinaceae bacterium LLY-WYZ-13_1]|nr:helix-turn-helix transcriptional regulator [Sandaracinaceae bacterium LLY-WYZ-13_1]
MPDEPISPPPEDLLERVEQAFMRRIGARIRELRLARGFTQADLSKVHGITTQYISQAENGAESLSAPSAVRIAVALGVEPYELYLEPSGEDPEPPKRKKPLPPPLP